MYWSFCIAMHHPIRAARRTVLAVALLATAGGTPSSDPQHKRKLAPPLAYTVTHTVLNEYPLGKGLDVEDLRWSPDGEKLAVAREDGQVLLLPDRKTLWTGGKQPTGCAARLWWSPDGRQLALLRDEILEVMTLDTGRRQVIGDSIFSIAWLPAPRPGSRSSIVGELLCMKYASGPGINYNIIARVSASRRGSQRYNFRRIPVSKNAEPTALSADGRVLLVGLPQKGVDTVHGALSVWHPHFPKGRMQWSRRLDLYWEYPAYARAVWSEPLQAVAVSFPWATDGASCRTLVIVTRTREIDYRTPLFATPTQLRSDPVWLGNQVIFAEGGWDDIERADRKWTKVISSLEVPRGRHEVLFSGADDYRAPAVSPDRGRLAYAEKRQGRWEVVVVAVQGSRLLALPSIRGAAGGGCGRPRECAQAHPSNASSIASSSRRARPASQAAVAAASPSASPATPRRCSTRARAPADRWAPTAFQAVSATP